MIHLISLIITTKCNRHCRYCSFRSVTRRKRDLDADHFRRLAPIIGHVPNLVITGGEPLAHPDFAGMVEAIAGAFSFDKLALATNGDALMEHTDALDRFDVVRVPILGEHTYPGCPDNSEARDAARELLGSRLLERPTVHFRRPGENPRDCGDGHRTSIVLNDSIYPCCVPIGRGVKLRKGWREKLAAAPLPCHRCVLASAADVERAKNGARG